MEKLLLNVKDAMSALDVDARALVTLIKEQNLPCIRLGTEIKFQTEQVKKWLAEYSAEHRISADEAAASIEASVRSSEQAVRTREKAPPDAALVSQLLKSDAVVPDDTGLVELDALDAIIDEYQARKSSVKTGFRSAATAKTKVSEELPEEAEEPDAPLYDVADEQIDEDFFILYKGFSIKYLVFETRIRLEPSAVKHKDVFDNIQMVLEDMQIQVADFEEVKKALWAAPGKWIRLGEVPNPFMNKLNIRVSEDGMRAYMVAVSTDATGSLSMIEIDEAAENAGIKVAMEREDLRRLIEKRMYGHLMILARGREPFPGRDADVEYHFGMDTALTPKRLESGDVDFKQLNNIAMARKDDLLATKIPALPGEPGEDVFGRPLEAEHGKDRRLIPGMNTALSDDGTKLYATAEGHVYFSRSHVVNIENLYFVDGDVDYSTGNIDFPGLLVIKGFVKDGFTIVADGDMLVSGGVEGATLESREGDIEIQLGIQGKNKAVITAAGSVRAKFISQAKVRAGQDIEVSESIMHSDIEAGNKIIAMGPKGSLIGGTIRAQDFIQARFLGAESHPRTRIIIEKIDPNSDLPVRTVLERQKNKVTWELDRCLAGAQRMRNRLDKKNPDPDVIKKLRASARKAAGLNDILDRIEHDISRFKSHYGPGGERCIDCEEKVYPQVTIEIEGNRFKISKDLLKGRFCCDSNGKVVGA